MADVEKTQPAQAVHVADVVAENNENASLNDKNLVNDAATRNAFEHSLTIKQAIKYNKWAIIWCLVLSMTVVMEGYDTILIGNFYAFPEFQKKYGVWVGVTNSTRSGYQLQPAWQSGLSNGAGIGAFFGALANGLLVNKFGQKYTVIGALVWLTCTIFMTFFAKNIATLLAGQVLCGLPWGVFATSAPAYASELLPMTLRVYFTSWTNMCFIIGQLIAAGILRGCLQLTSEWAVISIAFPYHAVCEPITAMPFHSLLITRDPVLTYRRFRIPFAIQWAWPVVLIPLLCFAPESPWHLVRVGKHAEAEAVLRRLQDPSAPIDPKQTLATIIYTNELEQELLSIKTRYLDCFRGVERRRTEIACLCFASQVICGSQFAYSATYFWEQVGLPSSTTYNLNIVGTSLALIAAICSWLILMPRFGRRPIMLTGMAGMATVLMIIGILNTNVHRYNIALTQAVMTMLWKVCFQLSVGQLGWAIPAEVGSTRLRQKTIVLARNSYYISQVIANALQPYFMNPRAWNLRGYTGFVWGGCATIMFCWAFFRLPETKDRTFEELDVLFAQKTPSRKFAKTEVDAFNVHGTDALRDRLAH